MLVGTTRLTRRPSGIRSSTVARPLPRPLTLRTDTTRGSDGADIGRRRIGRRTVGQLVQQHVDRVQQQVDVNRYPRSRPSICYGGRRRRSSRGRRYPAGRQRRGRRQQGETATSAKAQQGCQQRPANGGVELFGRDADNDDEHSNEVGQHPIPGGDQVGSPTKGAGHVHLPDTIQQEAVTPAPVELATVTRQVLLTSTH